MKCTFLRRIKFYFIQGIQLVRRFCSIIFHFAQLFYSYGILFFFEVYYVFVSLFFSYLMYCFIPSLLYCFTCRNLFWYIIFYITLFPFFMKNSLFFIFSKNYNTGISLYQLKSIHFHTILHTYVFLCSNFSFVYYHIIFHIASLSSALHTQSCFFVQIANVHFHHQGVSQYIVTHVNMITIIHLCHHHQPRHKVIQQNIIQQTKRQSMIYYNMCRLQKNKKHPIQIIQYKLI